MDVLLYLTEHPDQVVSIEDILNAVWPDTFTSDHAVHSAISTLRQTFHDSAKQATYIATVPKRGYQLVAPVHNLAITSDPEKPIAPTISNYYRWSVLIVSALFIVAILATVLFHYSPLEQADTPIMADDKHGIENQVDFRSKFDSANGKVAIAVLPFINMSPDPEQEYFSDGITEDILNTLVKTNMLPVIARSSSFQYKDKQLDVRQIAAELNVTHVLEGSVRIINDQLRITAQLTDGTTGIHLWSERYDRQLLDVFAIQDEIAVEIVNQIGSTLPVDINVDIDEAAGGTNSSQAFELYLQAKHLANTGNPFEVEDAIRLYEQAVTIDPDFADAWESIGITYRELAEVPLVHRIPSETNPKAISALKKALELNPSNYRAMGFLGALFISQDFQWRKGLRLLEQSIALNTQDARTLGIYGQYLWMIGHPDAEAYMKRAYMLSPFDTTIIYLRMLAFLLVGQYEDARKLVESAVNQNQDRYDINVTAGLVNAMTLRFDIAERYLAKASDIVGKEYHYIKRVEYFIARAKGNHLLAGKLKTDLLELSKHSRISGLWSLALEEVDSQRAVEILDTAITQRHLDIIPFFFADRPSMIQESEWNRMKKEVRIDEVKLQSLSVWGSRTDVDKARLQSAAIFMPMELLDIYTGSYRNPQNGFKINIEREKNNLFLSSNLGGHQLIQVGTHQFEGMATKISYEFVIENDKVTGLETKGLQNEILYIKLTD
jgi:TolB-like protein